VPSLENPSRDSGRLISYKSTNKKEDGGQQGTDILVAKSGHADFYRIVGGKINKRLERNLGGRTKGEIMEYIGFVQWVDGEVHGGRTLQDFEGTERSHGGGRSYARIDQRRKGGGRAESLFTSSTQAAFGSSIHPEKGRWLIKPPSNWVEIQTNYATPGEVYSFLSSERKTGDRGRS